MPAGDQECDRGVFERAGSRLRSITAEDVDADVADEVVDGVQRLPERDRERLRGADAHHECAGEPGSAGHRDRVEVGEGDPRLGEGGLDRRTQRIQVGPGCDLGHDAAVAGVLLHG